MHGARPTLHSLTHSTVPVPAQPPSPKHSPPDWENAEREQMDTWIASLRERHKRIAQECYRLGKALLQLRRREVLEMYGSPSFEAFVNEHIMPFRTAARYMRIARHFGESTVVAQGISKSEQIVRLHHARRDLAKSPSSLLRKNPKFGPEKKPLQKMTAKEVEAVVRDAKRETPRAEAPKLPRVRAHLDARRFQSELRSTFGLRSTTSIDALAKELVLRISLSCCRAGSLLGMDAG